MLAEHTILHTAWQVVVSLAVVAAGVGFVVGQWRRGRSDAQAATLDAQSARIELLEGRVTELEADIKRLHNENARLEGENLTLRSVLTGETVPPAQVETMRTVADEAVRRITEELHPIAQGITRLLSERGEP